MDAEIIETIEEGDFPTRTMPTILCCICGVSITANPANMCVGCLRTQVDITEGIPKQVILHQCRTCLRYLRPPWVQCDAESKELLAVCLKKITGLGKVKLIDAGFIWTEPHSRRLKVKLTIQKDVLTGVKLQQVFAVEFLLQNQQCDNCQRSFTDHTWRAQVQVRQKVDHKKTFYLLEQLIIKYQAHEKCSGVEQVPTGIDFSFGERSHAMKFIDFVSSVVPTRYKSAKQLISEDIHLAFKNFKFTYSLEVVPLCKDDLVVLPKGVAASLGNISPVALVHRVSSNVYLIDPTTLQMAEMSADKYWRDPFRSLMASSALEEFVVLNVSAVTIAPQTNAVLRRKQQQLQQQKARKAKSGGSKAERDDDISTAYSSGIISSGASVRSGAGGSVLGGGGGSNAMPRVAGHKRKEAEEEGGGGGGDDVSIAADSGIMGGGLGGRSVGSKQGFTGAVSLAGGSVHFNAAKSVASTVTGGPRGNMLLADVEIMRSRDLGVSDTTFFVRTHLGNLLRADDLVMGYDLTNAVYNDADADGMGAGTTGGSRGRGKVSSRGREVELPEVVLVRKVHPRNRRRHNNNRRFDDTSSTMGGGSGSSSTGAANVGSGDVDGDTGMGAKGAAATKDKRIWKLKTLDDVGVPVKHSDIIRRTDADKHAADYETFLEELESDPALRKGVNMYKDNTAIAERDARRIASATIKARQAAIEAGTSSSTATATTATVATSTSKTTAVSGKISSLKSSKAASSSTTTSATKESRKKKLSSVTIGAGKNEDNNEEDEADLDEGGDGGGGDDDEDDDDGAIGLEELLDELTIGSGVGKTHTFSGSGSGGGGGSSSCSSSSSSGSSSIGAGNSEETNDNHADISGAAIDPDDLVVLKAAAAAAASRVGKPGSAGGDGDEDDDDDENATTTHGGGGGKAGRGASSGRRKKVSLPSIPETGGKHDGEA